MTQSVTKFQQPSRTREKKTGWSKNRWKNGSSIGCHFSSKTAGFGMAAVMSRGVAPPRARVAVKSKSTYDNGRTVKRTRLFDNDNNYYNLTFRFTSENSSKYTTQVMKLDGRCYWEKSQRYLSTSFIYRFSLGHLRSLALSLVLTSVFPSEDLNSLVFSCFLKSFKEANLE